MDKAQAFNMIEQAKVRLLTEEDVTELGEWAEAEFNAASPTPQVPPVTSNINHVLIDWIVQYTKETRPTPFFSENFKRVNKHVMPWAVKCFNVSVSKS